MIINIGYSGFWPALERYNIKNFSDQPFVHRLRRPDPHPSDCDAQNFNYPLEGRLEMILPVRDKIIRMTYYVYMLAPNSVILFIPAIAILMSASFLLLFYFHRPNMIRPSLHLMCDIYELTGLVLAGSYFV